MTGLIGVATKERLFAMALDVLLATILALLVASGMPEALGHARWAMVVVIHLVYFIVQEGAWSTTLGKRLFGLRVAKLDGSDGGWTTAIARSITRIIEVNPMLLGAFPGGLAVSLSKRHQRLGDMLAGSVVVERERGR